MNKIAFIDDESNLLESLRWIFGNDSSYNLHLFQNPLDALAKIHEEEFAVVISDYKLPEMNGLELLKHIKRKWPLTECFITTGTPIADDLKNTDFTIVVKPWDVEDLKSRVQKAVSKYMENHNKS